MTRYVALGFVFCMGTTLAAQVSDVDVSMAITGGLTAKKRLPSKVCTAWPGFTLFNEWDGPFAVEAAGPLVRIALAANDAKLKYRTFTLADVTPETRADTLTVRATPAPPEFRGRMWHKAAPASRRSRSRRSVSGVDGGRTLAASRAAR